MTGPGSALVHIGIDLAWGEHKPTGIAVLDPSGGLTLVASVRSDADIQAALRDYVVQPCLVGIDAPLVVVNPTGIRPAEAALNRDFRRFEAGAHPSNTGKPEFAGQPRGARVAALLGLDIDPNSAEAHRAIEVYPHPAIVAIFGLDRTLKYKNKPGRTLESLRLATLSLMTHLESLASADPPLRLADSTAWKELVAQATAATRKSQLRHVEDQVDAVVCAYVAAFADRRPSDTTVYGDLAEGYIVTPSLRPRRGHRSTPQDQGPGAAIAEYAARRPRLAAAGAQFTSAVRRILDDAGINYLTVEGRTKSVESFAQKALRTHADGPVYADPLTEITDQIGVRVITYLLSDVQAVADLLGGELPLLSDRDMGQETADEGRFGYSSRHLLVGLDGDTPAQVQIRTVLQHAWAEFEHDIRYKGSIPEEHVPDLDRRFTLAAGLLELADREFSTIRERLRADRGTDLGLVTESDDDPRISPQELASFLAGQYADAGWSRTEHYAWIAGLLLELGITSLEDLRGVLNAPAPNAGPERMAYRYPPGAVRRLDDALLARFEESYLALTGNRERHDLLANRLAKLRSPT